MTRRRSSLLVLGGLLAASTVTIGAVTPASGDDGNRKIHFEQISPNTAADIDTFTPDVSRCTFTPPTFSLAEPCVVPIGVKPSVVAQVSGDLVGTVKFSEEVLMGVFISDDPAAPDTPFVLYDRFVGSVRGCGRGSIIVRVDGNVDGSPSAWSIVPHSGRGELAGITGSGTVVTDFSGPGGTNRSVADGRIRCGKHAHD